MKSMSNKSRVVAVFLFALVTFSSAAFAHETGKSVEEMTKEMMDKQNVTSLEQLDCNKMLSHDFEELGNAVMSRMVGSEQIHEQMDLMMGGEGSESLRAMHETMGRNWLGCGSQGIGMMPMMPAMMRMMGTYYPNYYAAPNTILMFGVIGWAAFLFVVVLLLTRYKIKIKKRK